MQKKKTAIVTIRMTPKVKEQLRQRAQNANMTLTDYLCICGLGQEIVRIDGLDDILSELKAQGRNLNQLTTLASMGRITVLRSDELINSYTDLATKTMLGDRWLVTGNNCIAQSSYLEMLTTKQRFRKTGGRQFYHFVQSFFEDDDLTPEEVNAIGVELAQREFPDFEVLVATHIDTEHLHNHLVVNSVSCVDGRKLHQNAADLQQHRKANDEICIAHGLNVLEPPQKRSRKKQMRPGEYQAGLRGDSWKLNLIHAINEALEYVDDRESFIEFMENEGYQVTWADNRKHITFTCPNGRKCREIPGAEF